MEQLDLLVPDRFDMLQRRAPDQLGSIVLPVDDALQQIDAMARDLRAAGRGGFVVFRGDSGSGKSTFLHTLGLFREDVDVAALPPNTDLGPALRAIKPTRASFRIIVIEGREALRDVRRAQLEAAIHDINTFIRHPSGEKTLIAWQCNADDLQEILVEVAERVGGDTLVPDLKTPVFRFQGPRRELYVEIAERTIATLNEGASLLDLGVSADRARELRDMAPTIGSYLGLLRNDLLANKATVSDLIAKERCRLWIVVAAGNEPDGDVAALTRGRVSAVDIDRLVAATTANIVEELKRYPEKLGILGAVLDSKILHLPMLAALGIARDFAPPRLREVMKARGLSIAKIGRTLDRLRESDLGRAFSLESLGPRPRGSRAGPNAREKFQKIAAIASDNDVILNEALGRALCEIGIITSFATECDLGSGLTRRTDLFCNTDEGPVRLEIMWRTRTSRADIANYTLTKLHNYGRAIGFLR